MVQQLNDDNFNAEVVDKGGVAVVDFWAAWCGPCRALGPHVEKLAAEFEGRARFYKCDVEANEESAANWDITSIPVILFFKDGKVVDKNIGLTNKDNLAKKLEAVLAS